MPRLSIAVDSNTASGAISNPSGGSSNDRQPSAATTPRIETPKTKPAKRSHLAGGFGASVTAVILRGHLGHEGLIRYDPRIVRLAFNRLMGWLQERPAARVGLVIGGVVAFAFWEPLFAGGSLVPTDLLDQHASVFNGDRAFGFVAERASGDVLNIHSHWTMVGRTFRDGWSWWNGSLGLGYPVMKGGFPVFALPYLVLPAWYAAGAMAAFRTVSAWSLTYGWLRTFGLRRSSALVGGAAFAFSGFVIGWGGWPHANVAALAPGLLWAVEKLIVQPSLRRGVPVGLMFAAMVWANFPLVLIYLTAGTLMYVAARLVTEHGIRRFPAVVGGLLSSTMLAAVIAIGFALPHIWHFSERLGWGDTTYRRFSTDSSAGAEYLLTSVFPAAFGSDGHGSPWWGAGNWVEFQIHVGAPVLALAVFAVAACRHGASDRRRLGAVYGLWAMVFVGAMIAYVGGPITRILQTMIGDVGGLATRSKVLVSLGLAGLAAFGFEAWLEDDPEVVRSRRRSAAIAAVLGAGFGLFMLNSTRHWLDAMTLLGNRRSFLLASIPPLGATVAIAIVLLARDRGWLGGKGVRNLAAITVVAELLTFAMPIPTVASAGERIHETESHELVAELLAPGERLTGQRNAFFANSTQIFDIRVLGGDVLKSPGYQALMTAVDPTILTVEAGGTPTYPSIPFDVDLTLSVWDALGIGVWALRPGIIPPGRVEPPTTLASTADLVISERLGELVVPPTGLRAVLLSLELDRPAAGRIFVELRDGDDVVLLSERRDDGLFGEPSVRPFTVAEGRFAPGSKLAVRVWASGDPDPVMLGIDATEAASIGYVAAESDGLELVAGGDVTLLHRQRSAYVRLYDSVVVQPSPERAAAIVVDRASIDQGPAVVDRAVDLADEADASARLIVDLVEVEGDQIRTRVSVDRAALLVAAENAYPGWSVTIDGQPSDLVVADSTLLGVVVPPGDHEVVFEFRPTHLGASVLIWFLTAVLAAVVWRGLDDRNRIRRRAG